MATRKRLPPPGNGQPPAAGADADAQKPARLVLRSGADSSSVAFTRWRGGSPAGAGDGPARGRRSPAEKRWQPPEGLTPEEVRAVIAAAQTERDRLLLRVLWATGGRVSEVLALRGRDVRRDALVLPNGPGLLTVSRPAK